MADFPTPPLFATPARGNPLEFLDETYPTKTRRMGQQFQLLTYQQFEQQL